MQPQKSFHLELSRLQLELIRRALDLELHSHESGFQHSNPKLSKKTSGQIIDLLKPSPQE